MLCFQIILYKIGTLILENFHSKHKRQIYIWHHRREKSECEINFYVNFYQNNFSVKFELKSLKWNRTHYRYRKQFNFFFIVYQPNNVWRIFRFKIKTVVTWVRLRYTQRKFIFLSLKFEFPFMTQVHEECYYQKLSKLLGVVYCMYRVQFCSKQKFFLSIVSKFIYSLQQVKSEFLYTSTP